MEVSKLTQELKHVEANGCTLSIEERTRLDLAIEILKGDLPAHAGELYFWGKIRGTIRDYYVVFYYGRSRPETANAVPPKHHFWCSSTNFTFSNLPEPSAEASEKLGGLTTLFSGEFDSVLVESNEAPKVIDAAAGIILPPKHLTEMDRLSVVVKQIDQSCSCVPKGSFKCTPSHTVCANEGFRGLAVDASCNLENWQHLRVIKLEQNKNLAARNEACYNDEFLDALSHDKPLKCWSILKDTTGSVAILRSQLWPGYYAYHRSNTAIFGGVYMGEGIQNVSLPFML